jgi:peptidoglycan/LPS O-acetylase OafA/YrhL
MRMVNSVVRSHVDPKHQLIVAFCLTLGLALAFASLALALFDRPARAWLARRARPPAIAKLKASAIGE